MHSQSEQHLIEQSPKSGTVQYLFGAGELLRPRNRIQPRRMSMRFEAAHGPSERDTDRGEPGAQSPFGSPH